MSADGAPFGGEAARKEYEGWMKSKPSEIPTDVLDAVFDTWAGRGDVSERPKVDEVLVKMKDLHDLQMKGIAKGEDAESMIAQASMMQTSGKALEKSAKATRAEVLRTMTSMKAKHHLAPCIPKVGCQTPASAWAHRQTGSPASGEGQRASGPCPVPQQQALAPHSMF